eukprot:TRINITY_DN73568_c0_g1_i1.p1 TRINITY_DN73568_c0_g1~~TRINITY_DN73568_c0_g1_i1.p1  ORF type:complete len:284 (-),score=35.60 TRINITY_DN73568_c0_g1_i1:78-884(-)
MTEAEVGFSRSEMFEEDLAGTAKWPGKRQLFLIWGKASEWPEKVPDDCPEGSLPRRLQDAFAAAKKNNLPKFKWNVAEAREADREGDVLIFPDYVRFRLGNGEADQIQALIDFLCRNTRPTADIEDISGTCAFVCSHVQRDARCGHCGPRLLESVEKLQRSGVQTWKCSHVGGHKYAGNMLVFSGHGCQDDAHWYGYVKPEDVASILDGKAIRSKLWRGQMGLTEEEQKEAFRRAAAVRRAKPILQTAAILVGWLAVVYIVRKVRKTA